MIDEVFEAIIIPWVFGDFLTIDKKGGRVDNSLSARPLPTHRHFISDDLRVEISGELPHIQIQRRGILS